MDHDIIAELRQHGYRITTARRAVLTALLESDEHLNAEQVSHMVQETAPAVDPSTVYRTLGLFEDLGIVEHAHLGHGPAVYHFGRTHQHLVCEVCDAVIDVPVEALDLLACDLERQYGFQLRPGHFALMGRCEAHAVDPTTGGSMTEHEHVHVDAHAHEHRHGDTVHTHAHDQHEHDHLEHEHPHTHDRSTHTHAHTHASGLEDDHVHDHA